METLSFSICLIVTVCFSEQLSYYIQKTHMDTLIHVKNTRAGLILLNTYCLWLSSASGCTEQLISKLVVSAPVPQNLAKS